MHILKGGKQEDDVWDLVKLIDELNFKKLEIMDEGSVKGKVWSRVQTHVNSTVLGDLKPVVSAVESSDLLEISSLKKAIIKERVMDHVESVAVGVRSIFSMKRFWGTAALLALGYLAHRKGLDSAVVSSVSNGAVTAYNTVLSEQAREALELAAQKSCHAVFHGSVFAWNATKKAGQVAVESAKRLGAYVVSLFKRRVVQPIVK